MIGWVKNVPGFFAMAFVGLSLAASAAGRAQEVTTLQLGQTLKRELAAGEAHQYHLSLVATQYFHLVVDQMELDVALKLLGPDGRELAAIDHARGRHGRERLSYVAELSGRHRIVVQALKAGKPSALGSYEIRLDELGVADAAGHHRVAGQRAFERGEQLLSQEAAKGLQAATARYEEALGHWRDAGDRGLEALALHRLGDCARALGKALSALNYYHQALKLDRDLGDRVEEAIILTAMASTHRRLGQNERAIELYQQAVELIRQLGDRHLESAALSDLGGTHFRLGRIQTALDHYRLALPIYRAVGDRYGEGVTLDKIGSALALDEPQQALDHHRQALSIFRDCGVREAQASALNHIGFIYSSLGDAEQAVSYHEQALALNHGIGDSRTEARTQLYLGRAYQVLGDHSRSLRHFEQSLSLRREIGDTDGMGLALIGVGLANQALGRSAEALRHLGQALAINHGGRERRAEAVTLCLMGGAYADLGEDERASDCFARSLDIFRAAGDRRLEADALYRMAGFELTRGDLVAAQSHVELALELVESSRVRVASPDLNAAFFSQVRDYYDLYIGLLMQRHRRQPSAGYDALALRASERSRARSLLELLAEARVDIRGGADPALLEREREARQKLNDRTEARIRLLGGDAASAELRAVEREIASLSAEVREIEARIRAASPRHAALAGPPSLSTEEIQRTLLDDKTLLLEYALGKEKSHLWVVSQSGLKSYDLPGRDAIEQAAKEVAGLIGKKPITFGSTRTGSGVDRYFNAARKLSRMLLGAASDQLRDHRLLIVADGALQYLPFGALPDPRREGVTAQSFVPLIVNHEIVSLPSAATLILQRRELQGRRESPKALAVLADPVFGRHDDRVAPDGKIHIPVARAEENRDAPDFGDSDPETVKGRDELPLLWRLPYSRDEARTIASLVPKDQALMALDFNANRETAMGKQLRQYRYVHFATHGIFDSQHPDLSGLFFSLVDARGKNQNGFLGINEVYNLKLPAELVVLSACDSALGKEIRGEGVVGLTRGFMYAGARRVVASLWKVHDASTAELMKRFYQGMLGEKRLLPAAALREAQVSMWREKRWQAPYYWAAFVLQGEW